MAKKKVIIALSVGIIASLIAAGIVMIFRFIGKPHICTVQIMSINEGKKVAIDSKTLEEKPNQDGILFIYVTGSTKEYDGKLMVEVQPKDVPNWFKQADAEAVNGRYIAKIQLGSREWPIRGGERYTLRVSLGDDWARAMISVSREKREAL